ncbi:N-acetylmuramoyl-L-alanine amidase CwlD [Paenibacillus chondroitinus]|uniref:N-acetylmuramoyl-L-alanine amidase CwlD n=1 Tax=Paenibacillus chondroitinus TaxID=59842 RepID=A0ABU6DIB5_9BACL|nr:MULTISPECIES: N-acetylmuramoyl-L-alanine amidase CwlD [Paenibacillus]MCY9659347.1 N-acetylmuramoyl-L-alanine amidase CwlD [Paenibacillus anseongense]MEB4797105.1 N-acetylmuramoyl-L-alanine amidase CwlD [Paenibacillus chondroitinus]
MRKRKKRLVVWLTFHSSLKLALSTLLVALVVFIYAYELPATKTWSDWTLPLSGKTIALDAGHGGPDGGASSKEGVIEKDINLAITLQLRDYLQQAGALVVMTRETDTDLADPSTKGYSKRKTEDLHNRADMINEKNADMFLSVHLNSIPSPKWKGAQTFYYTNNPNNSNLAALIQLELKRNLENTDRVAKPADKTVYLLKTLKIPSALVEVGFLSNPDEARLLADEKYQKMVAAAIYQGVLRFYAGEKVGSES